MKGKVSKFFVGLLALVGIIFVYLFNSDALYINMNDETKAAGISYPNSVGGYTNYINLNGLDFWPVYIQEDKIYLKTSNGGTGADYVGDFSQGSHPTVNNEAFKTAFMEKVNSKYGGDSEKAIYEILGSQVPTLRIASTDDFNIVRQNMIDGGF